MKPSPKKSSLNTVLPTILVLSLFSIAVYGLMIWKEPIPTVAARQKNEQQAFLHMQKLMQAQSAYIQKDFNENGTLEYARFIPHLWRSIGDDNRKYDVNLLPRRTAFAIKRTRAIDGYYFVHKFTVPDPAKPESTIPIDVKKEWGTLMIPAADQTGFLTFYTDQHEQIYANAGKSKLTIPEDPKNLNDWVPIDNPEQLSAIQKKIAASDAYDL